MNLSAISVEKKMDPAWNVKHVEEVLVQNASITMTAIRRLKIRKSRISKMVNAWLRRRLCAVKGHAWYCSRCRKVRQKIPTARVVRSNYDY